MSPKQADAERRRMEREAARARLAEQFDATRPTNRVEVCAAYLQVSRGAGYASCRDGSWPALRVQSRWLVKTKQFLALIGEEG